MNVPTVGLIGIGLLGSAIAERLLKAGIRVVGYDRVPECCETFLSRGGVTVGDAAEVFARCGTVLLSLPTADIVRGVLEKEAASALRDGHVIIDTTTGAPDAVVEESKSLAARGITYIDATVAASSEQMRQGDAVLLVGGPAEEVQKQQHVWNALAKKWFHVGPVGHGASMKLVSNLVMGLNRAALAEGLALAHAAGLDPEMTLAVLRDGNAYSKILDMKGRKMLEREFSPQSRLSQHLKDVELIRDLAEKVGAETPLSAAHGDLLRRAVDRGWGDLDNSALILALTSQEASTSETRG